MLDSSAQRLSRMCQGHNAITAAVQNPPRVPEKRRPSKKAAGTEDSPSRSCGKRMTQVFTPKRARKGSIR